ncbi:TPA: SseB family protein, partial [Listeria monocytogenes]|nr:SseB family protein [Listeria monocytogenes]HCA4144959.1 SseB family protein [Listeria monocytogenes]HEM2493281.1 SseB family protein [Listeria monocytogenes]
MNEQILLKNDDLLNIIKVLKTNYSKQVEEELYRQMQKSKLLLPAIIREENKISIVKIIDEKENEYLPVFTDWTNFQLYLDSTKESQP